MAASTTSVADVQHVLVEVSRALGTTLDLPSLLKEIERAALDMLDCERVTVFLYDPDSDELFSTFATGGEEIRFPASKGIAGEAVRSRTVIHVPDAYKDARFNADVDRETGFRTRNMLTFPMVGFEDDVVGVLQVLNKRTGRFTEADQQLAEALSALTGMALQRQMLVDAYTIKQKLERDLAVAREIQQALLPSDDPKVEGFDIAGWNRPADDTGGDCYDFLELPSGRLGLLLADVTGHGVGPAIVAAESRAIFRALGHTADGLKSLMEEANRLLNRDLRSGRFVTACFATLDAETACITYASAGQAPLLHYVAATDTMHVYDATTFPLGIMSFMDGTPAAPITLESGDLFILATDGFFEWADPAGEEFGIERATEVIRENRTESAAAIIGALYNAVRLFGGSTPQEDDLTAIVVKKR